MKYLVIILSILAISCNNIEPPICQNELWIIDDCGLCRECDSIECNWNATMNICGGCNTDLSSCTGCLDPEAINTESDDIIIHDESYCDYNNFININYENINPDYKIIRPGRAAYFVNNLTHLVTINLGSNFDNLLISPNQMDYVLLEEEGLIQYTISELNLSGILLVQNYD